MEEYSEMLNTQNQFGNTPLHWAVMNYQTESVKFLLDENVKTDMLNMDHQTALDLALDQGDEQMVEMIAQKTVINEDEKQLMKEAEQEGVQVEEQEEDDNQE